MEREQDEKLKYEMEFTRVIRMYYGRMQAQLADLEINGEAFDFTSLFQTGETE